MTMRHWHTTICTLFLDHKSPVCQESDYYCSAAKKRAGFSRASLSEKILLSDLAMSCVGRVFNRIQVEKWARVFVQRSIARTAQRRAEEHTSELQSLMRISYAVCCLKTKRNTATTLAIR